MLFLDLNGFKGINDALGHAGGDAVLQQVATRLVECTRTSDTVCRFGGDEFLLLLPELEGEESATAAADKVRTHLAAPYLIHDREIEITASIGLAFYSTGGESITDVIRRADHAMYRDKTRGAAAPSTLDAQLASNRSLVCVSGLVAPAAPDGGASFSLNCAS